MVYTIGRFDDSPRKLQYYPQKYYIPYAKNGKRGRLWYKLVAVIEHSGNTGGGHYYTHCLRDNGWCCINDDIVGEGSSEPSTNTFMIAYHVEKLEYIL
jgi:ubiquitin C-terminal hydrolase